MANRNQILNRLRSVTSALVELPQPFENGIHYDDPTAQFEKILDRVGGTARRVANHSELPNTLEQLDVYRSSKQILSTIPDIPRANVDMERIKDPRDLQQLDLAILRGEFAVAENAAVWVTEFDAKHRITHVIAKNLILVVPANQIVHNLHEAYSRLNFDDMNYGVFIAGPSKTADIAATLVKGAQGPCTLHVLLIGT